MLKESRLKNETVLKFMERRKCQQFHLASHSFRPRTSYVSLLFVKEITFFSSANSLWSELFFQFDFYEYISLRVAGGKSKDKFTLGSENNSSVKKKNLWNILVIDFSKIEKRFNRDLLCWWKRDWMSWGGVKGGNGKIIFEIN